MVNLNTCNFCFWGFYNTYDTFGHIFEAWLKALRFKFPNRQVLWLDDQSDISNIDFSNTVFISVNVAGMKNLPKRKDCMYVVHNTDDNVKASFGDLSQYTFMNYGINAAATPISKDDIEVGLDAYLSLQPWEKYTSLIMRWGTNLLPHEIEANKPERVFNYESKVVNFVGSEYPTVHGPFGQVCWENGILFRRLGSFGAPVSVEENIRLVKESYMAPAINNPDHNKVGYIPCRIFKNISYGQFGITNNKHVQEYFKDRLIFNEDTRQLFYDARERLPNIKLEELHSLMDDVAKNHTYLNKTDALLTAIRITQENKVS